ALHRGPDGANKGNGNRYLAQHREEVLVPSEGARVPLGAHAQRLLPGGLRLEAQRDLREAQVNLGAIQRVLDPALAVAGRVRAITDGGVIGAGYPEELASRARVAGRIHLEELHALQVGLRFVNLCTEELHACRQRHVQLQAASTLHLCPQWQRGEFDLHGVNGEASAELLANTNALRRIDIDGDVIRAEFLWPCQAGGGNRLAAQRHGRGSSLREGSLGNEQHTAAQQCQRRGGGDDLLHPTPF